MPGNQVRHSSLLCLRGGGGGGGGFGGGGWGGGGGVRVRVRSYLCFTLYRNHTPSGKKTGTGVQVISASQVQSIMKL